MARDVALSFMVQSFVVAGQEAITWHPQSEAERHSTGFLFLLSLYLALAFTFFPVDFIFEQTFPPRAV